MTNGSLEGLDQTMQDINKVFKDVNELTGKTFTEIAEEVQNERKHDNEQENIQEP